MGDKEGGRKSSRVAENPRWSCHGVGGGVESLQGTDTPGVAELLRGDKPPGVKTTGKGKPREDGLGRGGDKTPPTT